MPLSLIKIWKTLTLMKEGFKVDRLWFHLLCAVPLQKPKSHHHLPSEATIRKSQKAKIWPSSSQWRIALEMLLVIQWKYFSFPGKKHYLMFLAVENQITLGFWEREAKEITLLPSFISSDFYWRKKENPVKSMCCRKGYFWGNKIDSLWMNSMLYKGILFSRIK